MSAFLTTHGDRREATLLLILSCLVAAAVTLWVPAARDAFAPPAKDLKITPVSETTPSPTSASPTSVSPASDTNPTPTLEASKLTEDQYDAWGARSVAPTIILKLEDASTGRYAFDAEAMKAAAPHKEQLVWAQELISSEFFRHPDSAETIGLAPPELAEKVFQLYYCGRAKEARHFFDQCWPKSHPGKQRYWKFLMQELKQSRYYANVMALNS